MSTLQMTSKICSDKYLFQRPVGLVPLLPSIIVKPCQHVEYGPWFFFFKPRKERQTRSSALKVPSDTAAKVLSHTGTLLRSAHGRCHAGALRRTSSPAPGSSQEFLPCFSAAVLCVSGTLGKETVRLEGKK